MTVKFQVVNFALSTAAAGNNQAVDIAGFGQPKAVIFILNKGVVDNSTVDDMSVGIGFTDGITDSATFVGSNNGEAVASVAYLQYNTSSCIAMSNNGTPVLGFSFNSWRPDGILLDIDDAAPAGYLCTAIFIGGSDVSNVKVGKFDDLGVGAGAVPINNVGFEADLVFIANVNAGIDPTNAGSDTQMSFGCIHNGSGGIDQKAMVLYSGDGEASSVCNTYVGNEAPIGSIGGTLVSWIAPASDFNPAGFTLTPNASTNSALLNYLAIKFTNSPGISLFDMEWPIVGDYTEIQPGFQPSFGLISSSFSSLARNTFQNTGTYGYNISAFDTASIYTVQTRDKTGLSTTGSSSRQNSQLRLINSDGVSACVADDPVFTVNGWDFAITESPSTNPILGWGLAIGGSSTSVPPVDPPYTESAIYDGTTIPVDSILHYIQGTQDGGDNQAVFSDSTLGMTINEFVGLIVENRTDGSRGVIISNTATDIVATLAGGTDNNWDDLDEMHVVADIDTPDVMYCESEVTLLSEVVPILWYMFDDSASVYTQLYQQEIDAAGSIDGEYTVDIDTQGVLTLTLVSGPVAPVLTLPTADATSTTTGDGTVTTNKSPGTLFSLSSLNPVENAAEIKDADSQVVTSIGIQAVSMINLLSGTQYYQHYLHEDTVGDSNIAVAPFSTPFEIAVLSNPTQPVAPFNTLTASIDTDVGGGTLYYLVDVNPTALAAAIKAGDSKAVNAVGTQNITKVGLLAFTQYYVHYIQVTSGDSNIVNSLPVTTGDVMPPPPPTSTINDAILIVTGGPTINDGLAIWYDKQMSEALRDAEYRFLIENGATPRTINDMWFQLLTPTYGPGALNDMQLAYWLAGGVF